MANAHPPLHAPIDDAELDALAAQWGTPAHEHVRLEVGDPFLSGPNQQLLKDGRRAEICYIMHRGDPAQGLLLHIKTVYPAGAFRLPTGGVQVGEPVMATLAREITEETGLIVGTQPDQVQVQRLLGVVSYEMVHRQLARSFAFATYHFLVQMPPAAELVPQDPEEMIGGWEWVTPAQLSAVAQNLSSVGTRQPAWADWGHYRAVSHRFVASKFVAGKLGR
ncbi:MAG: NUDIX hydrolase [Litorilinea sp.]